MITHPAAVVDRPTLRTPPRTDVGEAMRLAFPTRVRVDNRAVVTITAYLDESGTHADSPAVVVAGYLALARDWEGFEIEWRAALGDFGIDRFHMSDFANGAQGFQGWPEPVRRERFARLAAIINRHVLSSVGVAIPMDAYRAAFSSEITGAHAGPYFLAATVLMTSVATIARSLRTVPWIAYVFESGARGAGDVLEAFSENHRDPVDREHFRALSLRFESNREFVPLQAADILAYELARLVPTHLGSDPRPARPFHLDQLASVPKEWVVLDETQLRELAALRELSPLRMQASRAGPRRPRRAKGR